MKCIYCESEGTFNDEHALSRLFGEFQGFPYLNCVCPKCNSKIGKAEEQLGRSGPEAFFREYLGIEGRHRNKKNPFLKGSFGAKPIDFVAPHPESGINVLWEFNPDKTIREILQVVVITKQNESIPIRIQDWMAEPEHLRAEVDKLNLTENYDLMGFSNTLEEQQRLEKLVQGLTRDTRQIRWNTQESSQTSNPVINVSVTDAYFRAVAKCVFHYLLAVNRNFRGDEASFKAIRAFIMHGGKFEEFVIQERKPILSYPRNRRPDEYIHVLLVEWNRKGYIQGRVQFFVGPDYEPLTYRVPLGQKVITITSEGWAGHAFRYFLDGKKGHGEAIPLTTTPPIYHI